MQQSKLSLFLSLIFLVTARPVWADNCGSAGPDQVIIYQQQNRGGACRVLGVGNYWEASNFGLPNDSISAIEVGFNVRAILYQDSWFGGLRAHYEGGFYYDPLGNVDNRTSSIEIIPRQGGPAATWYLGDYPHDSETFWSSDSQGLANDGANWFITKGYNRDNTKLFKIPLSEDLTTGSEWRLAPLSTGIPAPLKNVGYNHFGDLDQSLGFLLVPLENTNNNRSKPLIAVFSTVDLRFLSSFELSDSPGRSAPWLAIRPGERTLWTSASDLSANNQLREYDIDWGRLGATGQLLLTFRRQVTLKDRDGMILNLQSMQGGVFNPEGTLLYTSTGYCTSFGYIDVFAIEDATNTARLQASSEQGYGPFNFETVPAPEFPIFGGCQGDEAEGLDWLDVQGLNIPGIPDGQLHVIVVDNKLFTSDKVYLKHYSY
jgi:hypothetical protein